MGGVYAPSSVADNLTEGDRYERIRASEASLFCAQASRAGILASITSVVVVVVKGRRFGWSGFFIGDGRWYLRVARDLTGSHLHRGEGAYRYGRILYPLVGWLLAVGRQSWLVRTLPVVNAGAVGVVIACACELVNRREGRSLRGLVVLSVPGLWLCLFVAWADALLAAFVLLACLFWVQGREIAALIAAAAAALTKEVGVVLVVPLILDCAHRRRWQRAIQVVLSSFLPLMIWWTWVWVRIGEWPFLASTPSRAGAIGPPFAGAVNALRDGPSTDHLLATTLVVVLGGTGARAWQRLGWRWAPIPGTSVCLGVLAICLGPNAMNYLGDVVRVNTTAMILALLVLTDGWSRNDHSHKELP